MSFLEKTIIASGYNNIEHFRNSAFHPDSMTNTTITASIATGIAIMIETFLKLAIYTLMVGFTNLLAVYGPIETYWGYEFNHYKWLHYLFSNFVIINYILSNLENFIRLGWKDQFGLVEKIANYFNLHVLTIKKEKDEKKISK